MTDEPYKLNVSLKVDLVDFAEAMKEIPINDVRDVLFELAAHYRATGPTCSPRVLFAEALVSSLRIINRGEF